MTRPRYKKRLTLKKFFFTSSFNFCCSFWVWLTGSWPWENRRPLHHPGHCTCQKLIWSIDWYPPERRNYQEHDFCIFNFHYHKFISVFYSELNIELEPPMFTLEFFIINITIPNSWCSKLNPVHTLLSIFTKKFINWLPINVLLKMSFV